VKQHQFTERFLSESQARRSDDSAVPQHMNNLLQLPRTPSRAASISGSGRTQSLPSGNAMRQAFALQATARKRQKNQRD
jgi:hypothetical protein